MGRKKESAREVRRWMGNLLVAWTFVTGLAVAFASAWYYRTGDIKIILAYLGAPAIVGAALFLTAGILALATRTEAHVPVEADGLRASKQRQGIFGRR